MFLRNLDRNDIEVLQKGNVDINKCKILNYKTKRIYFYNILAEAGKGQKDCWASYTGLTTKRPTILCDILCKNKCFYENMKILDIGCGLSEVGVELSTRYKNIEYDGIDIIDNLLSLNKINLPEYNFTKLDIMNPTYYPKLLELGSKDIVCACGIARNFREVFDYIVKKLHPQIIILESHKNYIKSINEVIDVCKNYNIKKEEYTFYNTVNNLLSLPPTHAAWNRIVFILEKIN